MIIEIGPRLKDLIETIAIAIFNPFSLFIIAMIIIQVIIWSHI